MTNDTTTCDACGTRYAFMRRKDRCPICCPDQVREDESDNYEQADWDNEEEWLICFVYCGGVFYAKKTTDPVGEKNMGSAARGLESLR